MAGLSNAPGLEGSGAQGAPSRLLLVGTAKDDGYQGVARLPKPLKTKGSPEPWRTRRTQKT